MFMSTDEKYNHKNKFLVQPLVLSENRCTFILMQLLSSSAY
ncbi:hypothetical protein LM700596_250430 [Listeria monocytogenes]|nr:hypothetical protein LM700596_250430 [Listeria monocytogenes]